MDLDQSVTDVTAKPAGPSASQVLALAQKIQTLTALYLFIKGAKRAEPAGCVVQAKLLDKAGVTLALNSNLLLPSLIAEFDKLGTEIASAGIETSELFAGLNSQFENLYK